MSTPEPSKDARDVEAITQIVVRAVLALVLVIAYIAFLAFGVPVPEFFTGLVGLAAGFFVGGAIQRR